MKTTKKLYKNSTICFDLDGTICSVEKIYNKAYAEPNKEIIKTINELYNSGNNIIIFTGRNSLEWRTTTDWLKKYNVKYHQLIMNKPYYDVYIGDKAYNVDEYEQSI